jgi:hypothetical protein
LRTPQCWAQSFSTVSRCLLGCQQTPLLSVFRTAVVGPESREGIFATDSGWRVMGSRCVEIWRLYVDVDVCFHGKYLSFEACIVSKICLNEFVYS